MDTIVADRAAELLTVPGVARALGVGVRQLRRAVRAGEIPTYAIGGWPRVRRADVDAWVASRRVRHGAAGDVHRAATDRIADAPDGAPGAPRAGAPTPPATPRGVATDPGPAA
jgi:excisionase family DNA binding protein